jgi:hypothetical protein
MDFSVLYRIQHFSVKSITCEIFYSNELVLPLQSMSSHSLDIFF